MPPKAHSLTLQEHADVLRNLVAMEQSMYAMRATIHKTAGNSPPNREMLRLEKAIQRLKSALESDLYRVHPHEAAVIGLPHYGNHPVLSDSATRLLEFI